MAQILIVEDDNDINQAVTKFLTQQGAQIRQAYSGTEGILFVENVFAGSDHRRFDASRNIRGGFS